MSRERFSSTSKCTMVQMLRLAITGTTVFASGLVLYYMLFAVNLGEHEHSFNPQTEAHTSVSATYRGDQRDSSRSTQNTTIRHTVIASPKPKKMLRKVILYWSEGGWYKGTNAGHNGICGPCPIVRDRQLLTHEDTAAVIFPFETNTLKDYPKNNSRRADQLYIWWSVESPSITKNVHTRKKLDLREVDDFFLNGTITCRRDSLITGFLTNPIKNVQSDDFRMEKNITRLLARKNRTAVWFVSNCRSGSNGARRIRLSEELIDNGLMVDRFGKCFEESGSVPKRNSKDFFKLIETYRFYLSFENSYHCRDYITEKFYTNGLQAGAIPVVSGATRADYDAVAPPHSYIHVEDFNSTKELVDYLHYLENNETAYAEYFAWRTLDQKDFYPYGRYGGLCALCRFLYGIHPNDTRKFGEIYGWYGERYHDKVGFPFTTTLKSLHDWWYGTASEDCLQTNKS